MRRRPPRATRTDTLVPYTTLFRSGNWRTILPAAARHHGLRKLIGFPGYGPMLDTTMSYKVVSPRRPVGIVGRVVPSLVRPKCSRKTQMALNIQTPPSTEHSQVVPYRSDKRVVGTECGRKCR